MSMSKNIIITNEQFKAIQTNENDKRKIFGRDYRLNLFTIKEEDRNKPLTEAYYATYPIDMVLNHLEKRYHNEVKATKREEENGEFVIYVKFDDLDENQVKIDKDLSLCGYFPSEIKKEGKERIVCYEKRHQDSINDIVRKVGKIYHFTRRKVLHKIMDIGLCPRSDDEKLNYPERIYFFLEPFNISESKYFVRLLARNSADEKDFDYVLLEINTNGIDVNFYYDPDQFNAVYTMENIPPERISVYYNEIY